MERESSDIVIWSNWNVYLLFKYRYSPLFDVSKAYLVWLIFGKLTQRFFISLFCCLIGIEKVSRRRNEKSVPPLQSRKAEMTSGVSSSSVGSNQNKASSNPQLPGLSGARPTTTTTTSSSSTSSIAHGPVRGSVAAQPASRVESTNNVLPLPRPSTVSSLPSNASKKVTSARNHSKPARISSSSVFAPPRPFHPSVRALVADNPDLKLVESQGSTVVANHHGSLLVDGAVAAGLADADSSSACDTDTNYVVFEYPEALSEPDHYTRVVVNEEEIEEEVRESPLLNQQQDHDVMGTYPDTVGYSSEKSPDDASSADVPHQHSKEDDLLDDFFKFVSNGTSLSAYLFVCSHCR